MRGRTCQTGGTRRRCRCASRSISISPDVLHLRQFENTRSCDRTVFATIVNMVKKSSAEQNALEIAGPVSRQLYTELLAAVKVIGPFREEVKKTSIHLVRGTAFAGVHPRKQHLVITIKADVPIESARIA